MTNSNPNPYAAERPLIERLRSALPNVNVDTQAIVSGDVDVAALCPCVVVIPGPIALEKTAAKGNSHRVIQQWEFDVLVVHHQGNDTHSATRAGEIQRRILDDLLGKSVVEGGGVLQYGFQGAPQLPFEKGFADRGGYLVFPLVLQTHRHLRAIT